MHISEYYREQNRQLHASRADYGMSGKLYGKFVAGLCEANGFKTVLDYGCGKGSLAAGLQGVAVTEYDPAIAGKDALPKSAELVTCTDVLEHIEPEHLDGVLGHLHALAQRALFVAVHCEAAIKTLPDGRNAHLIQMPPRWWLDKLWEAGFNLLYFQTTHRGFVATLERHGE